MFFALQKKITETHLTHYSQLFLEETKYLDFNGSFHTDVAGGNSSALAF